MCKLVKYYLLHKRFRLQPCCIYKGKLCKYFLSLHPCLHFFNVHYNCVKVFVDGGLVRVVHCWVLEVLLASFLNILLAMKSIDLDAMAKPTYLNPLT